MAVGPLGGALEEANLVIGTILLEEDGREVNGVDRPLVKAAPKGLAIEDHGEIGRFNFTSCSPRGG